MGDSSRTARGKSFTIEQDEAICNAYLCITQDPIIGNSQPRGQFWTRVLQEYCEKTNDDQRSEASIKSRWQIIQKNCNKFCGCLRSVEALNQSGMTHQNEYDMAKQAYFEDTGKYFSGMDGCWAILEHVIKWQDVNPGGRKANTPDMAASSFPFSPDASQIPSTYESLDATPSNATPSSGGSDSVSSPRKRPGGRKLAKEKRAKNKEDEVEHKNRLACWRNSTGGGEEGKGDGEEGERDSEEGKRTGGKDNADGLVSDARPASEGLLRAS